MTRRWCFFEQSNKINSWKVWTLHLVETCSFISDKIIKRSRASSGNERDDDTKGKERWTKTINKKDDEKHQYWQQPPLIWRQRRESRENNNNNILFYRNIINERLESRSVLTLLSSETLITFCSLESMSFGLKCWSRCRSLRLYLSWEPLSHDIFQPLLPVKSH